MARRQESLDALVAELHDVETAAFRADLLDPAQLAAAVAAIEDRFGHVDVAVWSPGALDQRRVAMLDVDPDELPGQLELLLLAPIRLARLLLPGMRARGDGALLYASGVSALEATPQLGNIGIALAGMRNYVHGARAALADEGVHLGMVPIGGLIKNSAAEAVVRSAPEQFADFDLAALAASAIDPDDIAEVFWDLNLNRDRVEVVVG